MTNERWLKQERYLNLLCMPESLKYLARDNIEKLSDAELDEKIVKAQNILNHANAWLDKFG